MDCYTRHYVLNVNTSFLEMANKENNSMIIPLKIMLKHRGRLLCRYMLYM